MAHPHAHVREERQREAEARVKSAGYKTGSGVRPDAAAAVHKHERHDHKGEPLTPLRGGGKVGGREGAHRMDRMARGGKVRGGPAKVNVIVMTGGGEPERQMAFGQGTQVGAKLGAAAAARPPAVPTNAGAPMPPPRPPIGGPGAMPPAMGAPPMMPPGAGAVPPPPRPPGMMARGGIVTEGGAGGGEGRLEKAGMEGMVSVRAHQRRKAGGRVCD